MPRHGVSDGSLLPVPQSLTVKGAALNKVVDTLCKRKLAEERRTINGAPEWRRDEDGRPLGLFTTNAGLLALGVEDTETKAPSQAAASMPRQRKTAAARPRGKARTASPAGTKRRAAPSQSKRDLVDPAASAAVRCQHRRHHRQDRLAAAFRARLFQRARAQEAQASPRFRRGQGRRASLSHRADRILQGVSHDAVITTLPRPSVRNFGTRSAPTKCTHQSRPGDFLVRNGLDLTRNRLRRLGLRRARENARDFARKIRPVEITNKFLCQRLIVWLGR